MSTPKKKKRPLKVTVHHGGLRCSVEVEHCEEKNVPALTRGATEQILTMMGMCPAINLPAAVLKPEEPA